MKHFFCKSPLFLPYSNINANVFRVSNKYFIQNGIFNKELIIINTLNFEMHNQNLTEFLLFSFITEYRRHVKSNDN